MELNKFLLDIIIPGQEKKTEPLNRELKRDIYERIIHRREKKNYFKQDNVY